MMDEAFSMRPTEEIRNSAEYKDMRIKMGLDKAPKPERTYSIKATLDNDKLLWIRGLIMRMFRR